MIDFQSASDGESPAGVDDRGRSIASKLRGEAAKMIGIQHVAGKRRHRATGVPQFLRERRKPVFQHIAQHQIVRAAEQMRACAAHTTRCPGNKQFAACRLGRHRRSFPCSSRPARAGHRSGALLRCPHFRAGNEVGLPGVCGDATVDGQVDTGHIGSIVGGKEQDRGGDVLGASGAAKRDQAVPVLAVRRVGNRRSRKRCLHQAGAHRIDAHAMLTKLDRQRTREVDHRAPSTHCRQPM